ncbi:MAG: VOC family protein [Sterolibacteriaceae bacterium]|nr:VOC family protein [Sterolibacteriaceae bacterium]MBK9086764.1 VOC family protein [Sterolibacteriaceae bacterium]
MPNPFVHVELQTKDLPKAKDFYSKLFDWKLEDMPMPGGQGSYTMISVGEGTGGGMFQNPEPNVPPHWLAYVGVDDVRAMTAKARELGATVCLDVMEVGDFGLMSVIADPTGATLAMWQEKPKK